MQPGTAATSSARQKKADHRSLEQRQSPLATATIGTSTAIGAATALTALADAVVAAAALEKVASTTKTAVSDKQQYSDVISLSSGDDDQMSHQQQSSSSVIQPSLLQPSIQQHQSSHRPYSSHTPPRQNLHPPGQDSLSSEHRHYVHGHHHHTQPPLQPPPFQHYEHQRPPPPPPPPHAYPHEQHQYESHRNYHHNSYSNNQYQSHHNPLSDYHYPHYPPPPSSPMNLSTRPVLVDPPQAAYHHHKPTVVQHTSTHTLFQHPADQQSWSYNYPYSNRYYNDDRGHILYPPPGAGIKPAISNQEHEMNGRSSAVGYDHSHPYSKVPYDERQRNREHGVDSREPTSVYGPPQGRSFDWHQQRHSAGRSSPTPGRSSPLSSSHQRQYNGGHYNRSFEYAPPQPTSYYPQQQSSNRQSTRTHYGLPTPWGSTTSYDQSYYTHSHTAASDLNQDTLLTISPSAALRNESQPFPQTQDVYQSTSTSLPDNYHDQTHVQEYAPKSALKQTKLPFFLHMDGGPAPSSFSYFDPSYPNSDNINMTDTNHRNISTSSTRPLISDDSHYQSKLLPAARPKPKPFIMDDLDDDIVSLGLQVDLVGLTPLLIPPPPSPSPSAADSPSVVISGTTPRLTPSSIMDLLSVLQFLDAFGPDLLLMKLDSNFSLGWVSGAMLQPGIRFEDIFEIFFQVVRFLENDVPGDYILLQSYICEYVREFIPETSLKLRLFDLPDVPADAFVAILIQLISWITEADSFRRHFGTIDTTCAALRKTCMERSSRIYQLQEQFNKLKSDMDAIETQMESTLNELDRGEAPKQDVAEIVVDITVLTSDSTDNIGRDNNLDSSKQSFDVPSDVNSPTGTVNSEEPTSGAANTLSRAEIRKQSLARAELNREYMNKLRDDLASLQKNYQSLLEESDRRKKSVERLETLNEHSGRRLLTLMGAIKGTGDFLLGTDRYGRAYWWIVVEPGSTDIKVEDKPLDEMDVAPPSVDHPTLTPPASAKPNFGILVEHHFSLYEGDDLDLATDSTDWSYFLSLADIYTFISTLCVRGVRERTLRANLIRKFADMKLPSSNDEDPDFERHSRDDFEGFADAILTFGKWLCDVTGALPTPSDSVAVMNISSVVDTASPKWPVLPSPFCLRFGETARAIFFKLVRLCNVGEDNIEQIEKENSCGVKDMSAILTQWWSDSKLSYISLTQLEAVQSIRTLSHFYEWCVNVISDVQDEIIDSRETQAALRERKRLEAQREQIRIESATHFTRSGRRVAPPTWIQGGNSNPSAAFAQSNTILPTPTLPTTLPTTTPITTPITTPTTPTPPPTTTIPSTTTSSSLYPISESISSSNLDISKEEDITNDTPAGEMDHSHVSSSAMDSDGEDSADVSTLSILPAQPCYTAKTDDSCDEVSSTVSGHLRSKEVLKAAPISDTVVTRESGVRTSERKRKPILRPSSLPEVDRSLRQKTSTKLQKNDLLYSGKRRPRASKSPIKSGEEVPNSEIQTTPLAAEKSSRKSDMVTEGDLGSNSDSTPRLRKSLRKRPTKPL
ncbi:hypothetical protein BASA50_003004 [Batrachochytrium salamandrivorans]|uniref:WHIM2 domain-containing protein n=1 Tax=Batrachochytrium salamandrivorans TaxID=1357716 RepID=A0ABQ8FJS7_9FUNG|nr:hypothetical protein BASA50_003004 [Batrachochytrium salamandrivorans]